MSTLAELFPAGAGKEVDFVVSGAIAIGKPVGLNTDGTVTAIGSPATVPEAIPAAATQVFAGTHAQGINWSSIAFDPNTAGEFVVAWVEAGILKARVGSLSGTTATFGTAIVVSSATTVIGFSSAQYNPNVAKQFVIAFTDAADSYKGKVALGTVASSAITMQGDVTYDANNLGSGSKPSVAFDPNTSGKFVIIYKRAGAAGNGLVCTISGTTITANSPTTFGTNAEHLDCAFDQNTANKVVAVYQGSPGDYGQAVVGTVSGTGISFGSVVTFESGATQFPSVEYNPGTANKVVIAYKGAGEDGKVTLGTVSGTAISYATAVIYATVNAQNPSIAFDPNTANKFVISYNESSKLYIVTGTASSTTVTLGTPIVLHDATNTYHTTRFNPDSDSAGQFMTAFEAQTSGDPGTLVLGQIAAVGPKPPGDFLGISKAAISDTASGTIVLKGGLVTDVPALPASFDATVFNSDRVDHVSITFDSNSNKVVIVYAYAANSFNGYAVVGTVSGSSISYGTPVTFETGGTADQTSCTFDSNSNKIVIAYRDNENSYRGTAIVGTVSGTAISFGTPVVFYSGGWANFMSCTFDSDSNKAVIAYQDYGGSPNYQGTAIVGTVSGTSISFGTAVVFNAAASEAFGATFDSNSNKVVISYSDGGNSYHGTAIVGTVSGTAISFGSEVVFAAASTDRIGATFDSNSNKVVIGYRDKGNSNYGTAIVGTVSGTSISFGTEVVFEAAAMDVSTNGQNSPTFDSNSNKAVFAYIDVDNSNYGTVIQGTVSGTAISFGSPTVFNTDTTTYVAATFDSDSNKAVIAYGADAGTGDSGKFGKGGVFDTAPTLTIGSDYYAQADGSISTTATSPAVKLGRALSSSTIDLEYQS